MTAEQLAPLVTEAAALAAEISALEKKSERLDEIKAVLRTAAAGVDTTFAGEKGETATVKHAAEGIARSLDGALREKAFKLCGEKVWSFFKLAPIPAKDLPAKNFRVQVLNDLHKSKAKALLEAITVPSTPRVSFA